MIDGNFAQQCAKAHNIVPHLMGRSSAIPKDCFRFQILVYSFHRSINHITFSSCCSCNNWKPVDFGSHSLQPDSHAHMSLHWTDMYQCRYTPWTISIASWTLHTADCMCIVFHVIVHLTRKHSSTSKILTLSPSLYSYTHVISHSNPSSPRWQHLQHLSQCIRHLTLNHSHCQISSPPTDPSSNHISTKHVLDRQYGYYRTSPHFTEPISPSTNTSYYPNTITGP